jgi:Uncharacterised nucleotidyltransferase
VNTAFASEIVKCLRVSGSPEVDFRRFPASPDHWERILEWLDHSGLALIFWQRLKVLGEDRTIPAEIGERLERNLANHQLRIEAMAVEFDSINKLFEAARLKYAAMKGIALSADYCPDVLLRTTYDYDYLLSGDSIQAAEETLRAAGFMRKEDPEEHPIVYFHTARPPRAPLSRDDLYSEAFPRTVELHYLFWDAEPVKIPLNIPADPMTQLELRDLRVSPNHVRSSSPVRPVRFYALSEDDELIFQVLHAFRHILHDWCRLASLLDVAYFLDLRASDIAFWDQFLERLKPSRELGEIVGVVFSLASGLFGATIPGPVVAHIMQNLRRPLVVWVERYGQNSALNNFSDNKFSLFLHREFVPDKATWQSIQRSRLFPMHRPNQPVQASSSAICSRLTAGWRQRRYVAHRVTHHLMTTLRYGLESHRWNRARSRDESSENA